MRHLFDSTLLIAHLRGDPRATTLLEAADEEAFVSVMSRVEIEGGMRSQERDRVARLFDELALVPVSDAIARRAARHLRRFRSSHQGIDVADYVIAASAEEVGAPLATLNVKHFPMFPGLRAPY